MAIPEEDFLERLEGIVEHAKVLSRNETPEGAFSLFSYFLSVEIVPLLMAQFYDTSVPYALMDFLERYYIVAKGVNDEMFQRWKTQNPLAPFADKKQLRSYRVPPEYLPSDLGVDFDEDV